MTNTAAIPSEKLDDFSDAERWEAEGLVRQFGPDAENQATLRMIEALDGGDVARLIPRIRVRRCILKMTRKEPYMRRLTDKIAAAVEQALEQGRVSLAQRLQPAFSAAREVELKFQTERRAHEAGVRAAS